MSSEIEQAVTSGAADGRPRKPLVRLFTDPVFVVRAVRYALGLSVPMHTEDRRVLEQVIFGHYCAQDDVRRVLFVGCQWYTRHYERQFFPRHEFWTLEPDEKARRFGARRHVVAPLEQLAAHFPADTFDLILCNGVYGYGLDARAQCEAAFGQCFSRLREGGHFVLGWNDVPARTPVPLAEIRSLALFTPEALPALGTWRYPTRTPYRHVYDFYRKVTPPRAAPCSDP